MKFFRGFKYAAKGIIYAVNHERNMRVHIVVAIYLLYFVGYYNLPNVELAILMLVIALVLCLELVNTAIERVCDLYSKEYNSLIKIIKDVSAGAVLVAAIFAVAVACFLLWNPTTLWQIVVFHCESPERLTLFVLTIVIAALFIVLGPKNMAENAKSYFKKNNKE